MTTPKRTDEYSVFSRRELTHGKVRDRSSLYERRFVPRRQRKRWTEHLLPDESLL